MHFATSLSLIPQVEGYCASIDSAILECVKIFLPIPSCPTIIPNRNPRQLPTTTTTGGQRATGRPLSRPGTAALQPRKKSRRDIHKKDKVHKKPPSLEPLRFIVLGTFCFHQPGPTMFILRVNRLASHNTHHMWRRKRPLPRHPTRAGVAFDWAKAIRSR